MATITGSLSAGAWISSGDLLRHDRQDAHFGTEKDDDVVLSERIGPYPAGTTLAVFLAGLSDAMAHIASNVYYVGGFAADAVIKGAHFFAAAEIFDGAEVQSSLAAQWVITGTFSDSFEMDALIAPSCSSETC